MPFIHRALLLLTVALASGSALAADPNPATIHSDRGVYPLYRQWNMAELHHFAKFIDQIYEVKCTGTIDQRLAKIERVLTDPQMNLLLDASFVGEPSNPQLPEETIRSMHQILDCGKLTVSLTAYYAYRRGLPWMNSTIRSGDGTDIRSAAYNIPSGSISSFEHDSLHAFFVDITWGFCTGNYRVDLFRENGQLSDTVPVAIDRKFLLPGTVFYMDGHVLILARIDEQGEVYFLDSTTSPTRDIYTQHTFNAVTGITPPTTSTGSERYAGCYRGFRIQRFPIAETDETGKVINVRRRTDEEMREFGFSTEQYDKLLEITQNRKIKEGALSLESFHEFVRARTRTAKQVDPLSIIESYAERTLRQLQAREDRVQAGWKSVQSEGPVTFPDSSRDVTIFNANGRWGEWATAQTDAELRMDYFRMLDAVEAGIAWYKQQPAYVQFANWKVPQVRSEGGLAQVIAHAKHRIFKSSTFTYTNSLGQDVKLTLADFERRLFDQSFDPNHPPELRWGASKDSSECRGVEETSTPMTDGTTMAMWESYRKEGYYRSLTYREVEQTVLRDMMEKGYPVRTKFDQQVIERWTRNRSLPLLPQLVRKGGTTSFAKTAKK